jgi:hypothetical protein
MVHVNFEIYQGLLDQPSLRVNYGSFMLPTLAAPADDVAWGNRIVWLCARVLQWAQTDLRAPNDWYTLRDSVDEWERERPGGFNAFFYREADATEGGQFPELWFPGVCHGEFRYFVRHSLCLTRHTADAHQHLRICRIALALNDPHASSGQMLELGDLREPDITRWLKEMVAVARCNPHACTTPYIAAHAMHKFAVNLKDPQDQSSVMDFLEEVESVSGWPTEVTRQCLRVEWAWPILENAEQSNEYYL